MPLRLVARDGNWLIFNQQAVRPDVVNFFWGSGFRPSRNELYSRADTQRRPGDLETFDTHWQLPQTAFAARSSLYRRMRSEARAQLERLPSRQRQPTRPGWIPTDVWTQFLAAGEGTHIYEN